MDYSQGGQMAHCEEVIVAERFESPLIANCRLRLKGLDGELDFV